MKLARGLLIGLGAVLGLAQAQGVRSLGMGGVALPSPAYADLNPAYAGLPDRFRDREALPIGFLRFLPLFPETSPLTYWTDFPTFQSRFDFLSAYDQLAHPEAFLLNPSRSPDEVVFRVRADGVSVTDGAGQPLRLNLGLGADPRRGGALVPGFTPLLNLDLGPGTYLSLGSFAGAQGARVRPSPELQRALDQGNFSGCNTNPDPSPCRLEAQAAAAAGLGVGLGAVLPLEVPGVGQVRLGLRGEVLYGLAYGEAQVQARPLFDNNGQVSGVAYQERYFTAYPGQGYGLGLRGDLGLALDGEGWAVGLGVRNLLGYLRWQGTETLVDENGNRSQTPAQRGGGAFNPAFFLNGAYRLPLETGSLLLAGDALFGGVAPAFHLGAEYSLAPLALRAGVGYEGGVRFGLGMGMEWSGISLDLALTAHPALLENRQVYGLALAVGF